MADTPQVPPKVTLDDADRYFSSEQLNPPQGYTHLSHLQSEIDAWIQQYDTKLKTDIPDDIARGEKVALAKTQLKKALFNNMHEGAAKGGDPVMFEPADPEAQKSKAGFAGMLDSALSGLFGFMGGAASLIWSFLKMLPGVGKLIANAGEWISDKISGVPDTAKENQMMAAGVAANLAKPIRIDGMVFVASQQAQIGVYNDMTDQQFSQNLPPSTSMLHSDAPPGAIVPAPGQTPPPPPKPNAQAAAPGH